MNRYDFLLVCGQRTGSHFLGTCLASHPGICMHGEIGRKDPILPNNIEPKPGQITGAILMYTNFKRLEKGIVETGKVIHLVRDPDYVGRSRIRNSKLKKMGIIKAHVFDSESLPRLPKINKSISKQVSRHYLNKSNEISEWLMNHREIFILTVAYEWLTSGKREVIKIEHRKAEYILNFLGLKYSPLTTELRATGYGKE